MTEEKLAYISKDVLPILKNKWKNVRNLTFEPMKNEKGGEHYQSEAIFGDIVIEYEEDSKNSDGQTGSEDSMSAQEQHQESSNENGTTIMNNGQTGIEDSMSAQEQHHKSSNENGTKIILDNEVKERRMAVVIGKPGTEDSMSVQEQHQESSKENGTTINEVKERRMAVVIKMQICDNIAMAMTNGGLNFFNEIYFYKDILPYFTTKVADIHKTFPEMIHGRFSEENKREEDFIMLKNLNNENYRLTTERVFLDLDHILLALKRLGKFHACSYVLKSLDQDQFRNKINSLKISKPWTKNGKSSFFGHWAKCAERFVAYVESEPDYKDKLGNLKMYLENLSENLPKIFDPDEKMGVLCHGDFNRNNMFFKYKEKTERAEIEEKKVEHPHNHNAEGSINPSEMQRVLNQNLEDMKVAASNENEAPIDVKFFDLGDTIYASPVVDLVFFLFMNTTQHLRNTHWDIMIRTYHESIKAEADKFDNVWTPSYEDLCAEFRHNSMMGFLVCAIFLPMMMAEKRSERSEWMEKSDEENMKAMLNSGGDEATKAVADILKHMLDKGFI